MLCLINPFVATKEFLNPKNNAGYVKTIVNVMQKKGKELINSSLVGVAIVMDAIELIDIHSSEPIHVQRIKMFIDMLKMLSKNL